MFACEGKQTIPPKVGITRGKSDSFVELFWRPQICQDGKKRGEEISVLWTGWQLIQKGMFSCPYLCYLIPKYTLYTHTGKNTHTHTQTHRDKFVIILCQNIKGTDKKMKVNCFCTSLCVCGCVCKSVCVSVCLGVCVSLIILHKYAHVDLGAWPLRRDLHHVERKF